MRKAAFYCFIKFFIVTIINFLSGFFVLAQNTINVSGNTLKADGVAYAYSVGEVTGFSLSEHCIYTSGVIQPLKISIRSPYQPLFDNFHQALLYPNPTSGIVIIETNDPDIAMYQITAYDGQIVQTGKFTYTPINLQGLPNGLYLITLFSKDYKMKQSFKIVKL